MRSARESSHTSYSSSLTTLQLCLAVRMGSFICELVYNLHCNKCIVHPYVMGLQNTLETPKPGARSRRCQAKSSSRIPVLALVRQRFPLSTCCGGLGTNKKEEHVKRLYTTIILKPVFRTYDYLPVSGLVGIFSANRHALMAGDRVHRYLY